MPTRSPILLTHAITMRRHFFGEQAETELANLGPLATNPGDEAFDAAALIAAAQRARVIVADRNTPVPAAVFDALPELVAVVRVAMDIRNIDVAAASAAGVLVTHAGPGFVAAVAELIVGFMVDLGRGFGACAQAYHRNERPTPRMGRQLAGATLGIIGYGHIGRYLARLGLAFGMRVLIHDPYQTPAPPEEAVSFAALLEQADFVVCVAPATPQTERLMNADAFARMRPDAYFINASRGELVDDDALHAALVRNRIAGAALDVGRDSDQRPALGLAALPQVIAAPHIGGLTPQASAYQAHEAVRQTAAILRGDVPDGAANAASWTRRAVLPGAPA
ncbi:NAD(P)-dependent oxidoreductase [Burkholderia alba]|uniref:NAD(P)-dependent oxidoreductase n=1 Tax=Burkholderia alba TaxID=2683677 RepID=UPI002B053685|nr:NAD(P)-dependent oxidoreductase [Burkholderia alba]